METQLRLQFPERYAAVDPALLGPADVPLVVIHGQRDDRLPVTLARDYANSVGAVLISPADADHFSLIDPQSEAWSHVLDALAIVLER